MNDAEKLTYECILLALRSSEAKEKDFYLHKLERFVSIVNIRINKVIPERDKQLSKLVEENSKLREGLREGITLRDHFAGMAMQALIVPGHCLLHTHNAEMAYLQADTMLAERGKSHG